MSDSGSVDEALAMSDSQVRADRAVQKPSLAKRVRLPRLSGKASAAWLVICFLLTAVLIPMALRLPRWVAFEIVLAVWWAIWLAVLARLLYTGQRVTDDHQLPQPRNWFASAETKQDQPNKDPEWSWWYVFWDILFGGDAAVIVVGLILLVVAIWFLFEIAIPVLLFLLYPATWGMLARVLNDRHHCPGKLGRALGWGLVWATIYTTPLVAAVWFVHYVYQHSQPGV